MQKSKFWFITFFFARKMFFYFLFATFYLLFVSVSFAATPQELKEEINRKNSELQELTNRRLAIEKTLDDLGDKSQNLKQELKKIDYRVNQLNLSIKSGEITLEKLGLEIKALDFDIEDVKKGIAVKKEAIAETLREIQKKDGEGILEIVFRHRSLVASVAEAQSLIDFNSGLSLEVSGLKNLQGELAVNLEDMNRKKYQKELEAVNLKSRRVIAVNQKEERRELLDQTKNQEKLFQQQLSELEKRQAEISAEITGIEEELRKNLDPSLLPAPRPGVLASPLEGGRVTQKFGTVSRLYGGKPHNGLDLGSYLSAPITAAEKGKVIMVADQDKFCYRGAYGKMVLVEHENNLTTLYAHLSKYVVKEGDIINKGDLIGYLGKTGYATGPHLHFGVYASQTITIRQSKACGRMPFGAPLDPQNYL
ncbi:MAG: peptidoglycan DD-metalloendopeptidase family protein [Patescibacteria group bacterium]